MAPTFHKSKMPHKRGPTPGSVLPKTMKEEVDAAEKDDRKFGKKFVNKIANRKELRKQKRAEKGKRKAIHQQARDQQSKKRLLPEKQPQSNKRQKKEDLPKDQSKDQPKKQVANSEEAEKRLSKKNPALYKMLAADNLVGKNSTADEDFEEDDKEIAYWEKKLGLNKKKKKKLGKEFEDDGLLDVLGNADNANNEIVNMAKFYASLITEGALTLAVLKSINFMNLQKNGRIFLELLFVNILLQLHAGGVQAIANVFGKIRDQRILAQGCIFFIVGTVTHCKHSGLEEDDIEKVQWGCKIAKEVLNK
ncbi:hypothetical protein RMATCC62417_16184 [Rhizopus microsporus]|nr:hypothetical protein RMATCC62417_16184 [Rhizopus microsporus]